MMAIRVNGGEEFKVYMWSQEGKHEVTPCYCSPWGMYSHVGAEAWTKPNKSEYWEGRICLNGYRFSIPVLIT